MFFLFSSGGKGGGVRGRWGGGGGGFSFLGNVKGRGFTRGGGGSGMGREGLSGRGGVNFLFGYSWSFEPCFQTEIPRKGNLGFGVGVKTRSSRKSRPLYMCENFIPHQLRGGGYGLSGVALSSK